MRLIFKQSVFCLAVFLCFFNTQCEDDIIVTDFESVCNDFVIVDKDQYDDLTSHNYTLISATISDDCLAINLGASGCAGNTWQFILVDSGAVAESSPEQRYLKFQLINEEDCAAFFEREVSFDLRPLQVTGSNQIILNIEGFSEPLTYSY